MLSADLRQQPVLVLDSEAADRLAKRIGGKQAAVLRYGCFRCLSCYVRFQGLLLQPHRVAHAHVLEDLSQIGLELVGELGVHDDGQLHANAQLNG